MEAKTIEKCMNHNEKDAKFLCKSCSEFLCEDCISKHVENTKNQHEIISIKDECIKMYEYFNNLVAPEDFIIKTLKTFKLEFKEKINNFENQIELQINEFIERYSNFKLQNSKIISELQLSKISLSEHSMNYAKFFQELKEKYEKYCQNVSNEFSIVDEINKFRSELKNSLLKFYEQNDLFINNIGSSRSKCEKCQKGLISSIKLACGHYICEDCAEKQMNLHINGENIVNGTAIYTCKKCLNNVYCAENVLVKCGCKLNFKDCYYPFYDSDLNTITSYLCKKHEEELDFNDAYKIFGKFEFLLRSNNKLELLSAIEILKKDKRFNALRVLGDDEITHKSCKEILKIFDENQEIARLWLDAVEISDNDFNKIFIDLILKTKLCDVNITNTKISTSSLQLISKCIQNNQNLKALGLCGLNIGSEGTEIIASALQHNTIMQNLSLGECNIGLPGVKAICKTLEMNKTLKILWMGGNKIMDIGAKLFSQMLLKNQGLTLLDLSNCEISTVGALEFINSLKVNFTLKELLFYSNARVDPSVLKNIKQILKSRPNYQLI